LKSSASVKDNAAYRDTGSSYHIKNMNIFVKMFDDRLEIESPGPFPPGVTAKSMEALHYLEFVKAANEGVRRMRRTMLELDLPEPEFSQTEIGGTKVRVVLRNNIGLRKLWIDSDVAALIGTALTK
jgi:ATP-dependent DNA helicase RecG